METLETVGALFENLPAEIESWSDVECGPQEYAVMAATLAHDIRYASVWSASIQAELVGSGVPLADETLRNFEVTQANNAARLREIDAKLAVVERMRVKLVPDQSPATTSDDSSEP